MAKSRMVNTRFWVDDYISNLDPLEKLLFLYFLTNPSTDICGIYELPLKNVGMDTGIDTDMVVKILQRFSKEKRIFYVKGWVAIKNFTKHQSINPKVKKGIELGLSRIPKEVKDRLSIAYGYSIDSLSHSNSNLNSNSNSKYISQAELASIFSRYKEKIHPNAKMLDKAKEKISLRRKSFSLAEILKAIDNFSEDSWCMKNNATRGMAWFFHTDDRIERYVNLVPQKKITPISDEL